MIEFMRAGDLTIRQVEAFRAFMQRRSVTRAAEMLYISQPAMSRLLSDCEESLGFVLFERIQGRLSPTAEAHLLYDEVKRVFLGLDRIALTAEQIRTLRRGSLRIASAPLLGYTMLPEVIADFLHDHEGVDIMLQLEKSRVVLELLSGQYYDVCFVIKAYPGAQLELIHESPMVCVLPLSHPLANKRVIRPEDLENQSFVSFPETDDSRIIIDKLFSVRGIKRKTFLVSQLSHTVIALVEQGLGVSLVDPISAQYARTRVAIRKFEPFISCKVYLATLNNQPMSSLAKAFVQVVQRKLDTLPLL